MLNISKNVPPNICKWLAGSNAVRIPALMIEVQFCGTTSATGGRGYDSFAGSSRRDHNGIANQVDYLVLPKDAPVQGLPTRSINTVGFRIDGWPFFFLYSRIRSL